jgi:hypothetical protein
MYKTENRGWLSGSRPGGSNSPGGTEEIGGERKKSRFSGGEHDRGERAILSEFRNTG